MWELVAVSNNVLRQLRSSVNAAQADIRELKARIPPPGQSERLDAVLARIEALEGRLNGIERGNK